MAIPLDIADQAGQGELWGKVRAITNDLVDATNRGDKHEAKRLERRLDAARTKFHQLHHAKERPHDHD